MLCPLAATPIILKNDNADRISVENTGDVILTPGTVQHFEQLAVMYEQGAISDEDKVTLLTYLKDAKDPKNETERAVHGILDGSPTSAKRGFLHVRSFSETLPPDDSEDASPQFTDEHLDRLKSLL